MDAWLGRDLSEISLAALMIDGVHVDEHVLFVALGIDVNGNKHVLGVREGATENSTACTELLADLVDRNLRTDYTILAVLDGSKALAKAVRAVWGRLRRARAQFQCARQRAIAHASKSCQALTNELQNNRSSVTF